MSLDFDSARLFNPHFTEHHKAWHHWIANEELDRFSGGGSEEIMQDLAARQYGL